MTEKQNTKYSLSHINQKASMNRDSLTRWVVDLHHTRVNEQSGFQSVTHLMGFTHQSHRFEDYIKWINKNNLEVVLEAVFSSLRSMVHRLKPVIISIAKLCLKSRVINKSSIMLRIN